MEIPSGFLQRCINWLAAHRSINLLLIFLYFIFIYYMHMQVVDLSVWVMNNLSLPVYNKVVVFVCILLLVLFVMLMIVQLKKYRDNLSLKITYLLIILAIIIIHFNTMFEMNIEIIHIFEYSILTLLIFPVTRRFGASILFTLPLMVLDEWHQYIVLYPRYIEYFEFNDVMMDMYGAGLAMVALMTCGARGGWPVQPLWKRAEFILLAVSLIAVAVAIHTCFIAQYESGKCANTWLVLNTIPGPVTFWRQFPGRDVIYHIMQPVEAIISIACLSVFYFGLDSLRKERAGT
jgi:hypothetical protein